VKEEEFLARDLSRLRRAISKNLSKPVTCPSFIILVGLPGSGKSYFAARLGERIPAVILESDFLRKTLVRRPVYSQWESVRLFRDIHALAKELLSAKYSVLLDATNLSEDSRSPLYAIAKDTGARAIVVHLKTPRETAEERLSSRTQNRDGYSEADWAVYQKLETGFEPIERPHYEVTNPMDISPVIDKIVAEIKHK